MIVRGDKTKVGSAGLLCRLPARLPVLMLALLAVDLTLVLGQGCGSLEQTESGVVPDQIVVSIRPGVTQGDLAGLLAGQNASIVGELHDLSAYLVGMDPGNREQLARSLRASPLVEEVLNNRFLDTEITPNDPDLTIQWFLQNVLAPQAWSRTTGSGEVLVAVLDTGIDASHPEFEGKLRVGANSYGGSAGSADVSGHGTAVAGIIGAEGNNSAGVASIAWGCPILPIRVTGDDGRATSWSIAAGIALAVDHGAKVINISFAPLYDNEIVLRQARLAWISGSLVVVSADNSGRQVNGGGSDEVLFVGATDRADALASFSTYGEFVDLVAPGVSIYSTRPGGSYGASSGTSFAAPIVSGTAALVWSVNPDLRPATVRDILLATARDLGEPGWDLTYSYGCVDAAAAVELAAQIIEQQDTIPPAMTIVSPSNGASISSATVVQVEAADALGIAEVVLYVDGARTASDAVWPYGFMLDPARYSSGGHEVRVTAADIAGNIVESRVNLMITSAPDATDPTVTITVPNDGATVRGMVTIIAETADDRTISLVEVLIDGQVVATVRPSEVATAVAHNWNTADVRVAIGSHRISVRATDARGNTGSDSITVSVTR